MVHRHTLLLNTEGDKIQVARYPFINFLPKQSTLSLILINTKIYC